jgi:hypothetical protein
MKRAITTLLLLSLAAPASAQTFTRRRVPAGEVTGLEMGIEGSLVAIPGGHLRWFITTYEVVQRRDLRPSPRTTVRVTASYAPGAPLLELETDPSGRASIDLALPEDLDAAPHVMLETISPRNVRRVFEVDLTLVPRYQAELFVDRAVIPPNGSVAVFGRVMDRARNLPASAHEVHVVALQGRQLGAPLVTTTNGDGAFWGVLPIRSEGGSVTVRATMEQGSVDRAIEIARFTPAPIAIAIEPERALARPSEVIGVDVVVRTADGVPVRGAALEWREEDGIPRREDRRLAQTDAEGRARIEWPIPRWSDRGWQDLVWHLRAVHPAHGANEAEARVRVARDGAFVAFAVEGGALAPGLEGQVALRIVGPDGAPLAQREISADVPRLGGVLRAMTDADGIAVVTGIVAAPTPDDPCGGPTAASATVTIGESAHELCLPVDPDRTLVLRAVLRESRVQIEIRRRADVARAPVVVTALVNDEGVWHPVAEALASANAVELALPDDVHGEVWLRARAIVDGRVVRGGGAMVWAGAPPAALQVTADASGAQAIGEGAGTVALFALDVASSRALSSAIEERTGPVAAELASHPGLALMLARGRTPPDEAVSAVLRDGDIVVLPLPETPTEHGLLRDPWRTRARFARGRIGRVMLAVESYVAAHVPGELSDVAVPSGAGYRFNTEILEGALEEAGVGGEGAAALDGEPLDIDTLRAMDAAFTYDNVARRITRERLWRVHRLLRSLSLGLGLDRPWARRGDPTLYLVAMLAETEIDYGDLYPEREQLFDGWGRPFAIVRGAARFAFLDPVPGYRVVSAGPDGRVGTRDDIDDPFARVLPSGGLYAEAVGEDALLARLNGVELGRAMVGSLGEAFEIEAVDGSGDDGGSIDSNADLPPPIVPMRIEPVPVAPPLEVLGGVGDARRAWTLPRERRRYAAMGVRFAADGTIATGMTELVAGSPFAVRAELPVVMRPGDELTIPIAIVRLGDGAAPDVSVDVRGRALSAALDGERITLRAGAAGLARVRITASIEGRDVWSIEERVRVVPDGQLRARHMGALAGARTELAPGTPAGARPWRTRVIVTAARSLDRDPMFAALREAHPAPFAWAHAMRGETIDPELLASLSPAEGTPLERACALTALASAGDERAQVSPPPPRRRRRGEQEQDSSLPSELSARAAVLAALAPSVPGAAEPGQDRIGTDAAALREDGWRTVASDERPSALARVAAGLLLVDHRDAPGLALLERARASIERDANGRAWVRGDAAYPGDAFIGTLALAIAARQAGDDALADELARSIASRLYLASRTGLEGAFWAIAASVYGAFGVDAPEAVDVSGRALALTNGAGELAIDPSQAAAITSAHPVLARVEARFVAEIAETSASVLRASVEGDLGRLGERSALELVMTAAGGDVASPVVELVIPSAARIDEAALVALRRGAERVDGPDAAGVLRLTLPALADGASHRVPLPWRWIARGSARGLALTAYDAAAPWTRSTVPSRTLTIEAP